MPPPPAANAGGTAPGTSDSGRTALSMMCRATLSGEASRRAFLFRLAAEVCCRQKRDSGPLVWLPPASVGGEGRVGGGFRIRIGEVSGVLRQQVVPHDEPRPVQLRLSFRAGEEPHVQMRAAVSDPVYVGARDVRQRLDMPRQMRSQ